MERLFSITCQVCRWDHASLDPYTIQMILVVKLFNPKLVVEEAKEEATADTAESLFAQMLIKREEIKQGIEEKKLNVIGKEISQYTN